MDYIFFLFVYQCLIAKPALINSFKIKNTFEYYFLSIKSNIDIAVWALMKYRSSEALLIYDDCTKHLCFSVLTFMEKQ